MSFDLGSTVPLSAQIRDGSGALADAGSVSATLTLPDGTTASSGVIASNPTGVYTYDYPSVQVGRHEVRWVATGANASAWTDFFEVLPAVAGQVISLADAKRHLKIPAAKTADDGEIQNYLRAITRICERYVGAIARTAYTQTFDGGQPRIMVDHRPVLSVTSLTEFGTVLAPGDYRLIADSGVIVRMAGEFEMPFLWGSGSIVVSYAAGVSATPPNVIQAAKIILAHMWETQRSAATGRPPLGEEPMATTGTSYTVPYRAQELLGTPVGGIG
jgi:hypothetical protein